MANAFHYSIGRKFIQAVSGAFLIIFLLLHATINFFSVIDSFTGKFGVVANDDKLFSAGDGLFQLGCDFMSTPVITIMVPVLALGFLIHIGYGIYLSYYNMRARGGVKRYEVASKAKADSWASTNMLVLGIVILGIVFFHLTHFWADMQLKEFTGGEAVLVLFVLELDHVLPPLEPQFDHLLHAGVPLNGVVHLLGGVSEIARQGAHDLGVVVQEGHAAGQAGVLEDLPCGFEIGEFLLVVPQSGVAHEIGDAVVQELGVHHGDHFGVEVLEIGEFFLVQFLDHPLVHHFSDEVVRGDDDVISCSARLELGEHHFIGVEDVLLDDAVVFLFEAFQQFRGEVVRPGVDVENLFSSAACECHGRKHKNEKEQDWGFGFHFP